jgi:hypothetical protein
VFAKSPNKRDSWWIGDRTVTATVLTETYDVAGRQHRYLLDVLSSAGCQALRPAEIRRRDKDLRQGVARLPWPNESARAQWVAEKRARRRYAQSARGVR